MSKFFVGQRVRVVHSDMPSDLRFVGREARITQVDSFYFPYGSDNVETCYGLDIAPIRYEPPDFIIGWAAHELEPILPDGHRAGEEGKCELLDELLERQREVV